MLQVHAPDVRRAQRAVAAAFFINGTIFGIWATQVPLVKERLDLGPALLGGVLFCMAAGALLGMPLAGALMGRFGSAALVRGTAAAFCALLPVVAAAPTVPLLALALFLFGAAGGAMDVAMNAHGVAVERRLARSVMSALHGMWSLGGLVGAAGGGALLGVVSPVQQAAAVGLAMAVLLGVAHRGLLPASADRGDGRVSFVLPGRASLLLGVLMFVAFMAEGAILDWSAVFLKEELGAPGDVAAAGYAAFSGAMAGGRFLGDAVRHRLGPVTVVRCGAALAALGLVLGLATHDAVFAVIGFGLVGIGLSNVVPILFSAAGAMREGAAGTAVAAVATLGYAGLLAGPPALGFVAAASSVGVALGLVAVLCALIGGAAVIVRARPL